MRLRFFTSAILGVTVLTGSSALAQEPKPLAPLPVTAIPSNQALADVLVSSLRQSSVLKHYRVDVSVRSGVVDLTGTVSDAAQLEEVLRLIQSVPAVERVANRITVTGNSQGIIPVQGPSLPPKLPEPISPPGAESGSRPAPDMGRNGGGLIPDPVPMARMAPPAYAELNPPRMPPYAWPSYAPHNNFSRVATPTAFPYQAFPFIGPLYPFPKVPLGWRSVKLEWDDGYWWFGQVGNKYNWWKLRYH